MGCARKCDGAGTNRGQKELFSSHVESRSKFVQVKSDAALVLDHAIGYTAKVQSNIQAESQGHARLRSTSSTCALFLLWTGTLSIADVKEADTTSESFDK